MFNSVYLAIDVVCSVVIEAAVVAEGIEFVFDWFEVDVSEVYDFILDVILDVILEQQIKLGWQVMIENASTLPDTVGRVVIIIKLRFKVSLASL